MALTNRQRGDYFERQVVLTLRAHGWVCQRSAGSLGPADVWAMKNGKTPLFVACKLGGRIDPHERTAILDVAEVAGARAVLAMRPRGGRVLLAQIHRGSSHVVPIDTLRVPVRPGKEPAALP